MMRSRVQSLFFLAVLFLAPVAGAGDPGIEWRTDVGNALKEAARSGKPVLVDVWAVWCAPCKLMEETTYRDARVVQAINGRDVIPLKVDADVQKIFTERYDIDAYPTVLFLDDRAGEITRRRGLLDIPEMLEATDLVCSGYESYLEAKDSKGDAEALASAGAYLERAGNSAGAAALLRRAVKQLKGGDSGRREELELALAESLAKTEESRLAIKYFDRLSGEGATTEIRGRALLGLLRMQRERGRDEEAQRTLARLRAEHPELEPELGEADGSEPD